MISYFVQRSGQALLVGLSTDSKPTPLTDAWMFIEQDTAKIYKGVSGAWAERLNTAYAPAGGGERGPHASTHQNGGADEINVGGLSGVLADAQTPAAHSHAQADVTNLVTDLAGKAAASHTHPWADITGEPTTLAGYGITDAATDAELAAHEGDSTNVHGIANTANLALVGHVHAAGDITTGTIATARLGSGTADATTFLRGDQTYAAPPGGGGGETAAVLSADTGRTVLALGESGLSFLAAANTRYAFRAYPLFRTAATTTGIAFQATGPAANFFVMQRRIPTSLVAVTVGQARAYNSGVSTTAVDSAGGDNLAILEGLLSVAGSAGTFHITYGSEIANSRVSVMAGSVLLYRSY